MITWSFNTVTDEASAEAAGKWYWRANTTPPAVVTSVRLFPTLDECAADARSKGFDESAASVRDMQGSAGSQKSPAALVEELASAIWV